MSLSKRVRSNIGGAPWVIDEIKLIASELAATKQKLEAAEASARFWSERFWQEKAGTLSEECEVLKCRIRDWERRSESCESKLGQLEANERVMELEQRIRESQEYK